MNLKGENRKEEKRRSLHLLKARRRRFYRRRTENLWMWPQGRLSNPQQSQKSFQNLAKSLIRQFPEKPFDMRFLCLPQKVLPKGNFLSHSMDHKERRAPLTCLKRPRRHNLTHGLPLVRFRMLRLRLRKAEVNTSVKPHKASGSMNLPVVLRVC